jgi:phage terminase large subunit-like protein
MTTAERRIVLPRRHPSQQAVVASAARFNAVCCGRRWGKTTLGIDRVVPAVLAGAPVGWFSPTYKLLTEVWRDARRVLAPATARVSVQEHRIELVTGGVFELWSLETPNAARGRRYRLVVVDEAAMVHELEEAWTAAIRPTLVDFRGGAWFLSTPKGHNHFKTLFDLGQDPRQPDWASWQLPTLTNPLIDAAEVDAARLMLPELTFSQEFLARFVEGTGAVFRRVRAAATAAPQEWAVDGHRYAIGADWGKYQDFTVLTVLDCTLNAVVHVDRFNQIDYAVQKGRLQALCERFRPDAVIAEQNSMGVPLVEDLVRMGLPVAPFQTTNASKAQAVDALALAFEQGHLTIPDDPVLIGELEAYTAVRLPGGLLRYSAPEGGHDDCVVSLMLVWLAAANQQNAFAAY